MGSSSSAPGWQLDCEFVRSRNGGGHAVARGPSNSFALGTVVGMRWLVDRRIRSLEERWWACGGSWTVDFVCSRNGDGHA
eukprot:851455-Pyramimonas_sp.AAC.1